MDDDKHSDQGKQECQLGLSGVGEQLLGRIANSAEIIAKTAEQKPQDGSEPAKPFFVQEVGGDDLEPFEEQTLALSRETLVISRRTYRIAFYAFLAAAVAAAFVGVQVKEMTYQTQILASQSESAVAGSLMDGMNTRKQLGIAQQQAKAAQDSVNAIRRQTIQQVRPWMSIEKVNVPEDESLIVNKRIIITTVAVTVKNIGHSPATHVAVRVLLSMEGTGSFEDTVRGECDNAVIDTDTPFGETIFQDRFGTPIEYPIRLSPNEVAQYWKQRGGAFSVIGCVAYKSPISQETYYTGFIYTILLRNYPEAPAQIPGKDVSLQNALGGFITK